MQHRSLEILREKVSKDRSTSEKVAMEQLDIRNELLGEMESKVKLETQRNQEVFETFKRLKGEHEEEKIRLTQEHKRLQQLQDDLTAESTVLRDSIVTERERLKKDRGKFDQDQSAWAIRQKREAAELEMRASMCARASKQAQHDVEETNKQRIDIMRQLDIERQQLRVEKKSVNMRKKRMDGEEGALRVEQARIKEQVRFIEEKMQELAVLGEKVKQQSHICAAATAEIEDAKKEVMMMQHETLSLKQEAEVMHAEANQETKRLQQERVQFEKERLAVLKESQVTKEHNESLIDEKNNLFIERERLQKKYKALTEREKRRGRSRSVDGDANKDIEHNQHNKDSSVTFSEPPHVNIKVSDSKDVYNTSNFDQSFSKAFTAGHDTSLSVNSNPNHPYFNNTSNINIGNNNNNNSNSNTSLDYLEAEGRFLEEQLSKIHRDREWIESLTYA